MPPSPDFFVKRIKRAADEGFLGSKICSRLLAKNEAADEIRVGTICFVSMRSYLSDASRVYHLFELWGGEAIYGSH